MMNTNTTFNFRPSIRPAQLELHIQRFNMTHHASCLIAIAKPVYQAINRNSSNHPFIVFVPSQTALRGVAYLHESLNHKDRTIVEELYTAGGLQVCIVSCNMLWTLYLFSYLVIIMDTKYYDRQDHTYDDYPISDILQIID
ncbi:unnamed protein product [Rotaria sp. Silwood2]|nr:unnamed protein product [Rotaria sp. Silwood2]CAF2760875.1 unnamed protein product [Rotaria sp. Silwood2]CAF4147116.1 unnamed protein product [Rotaria sp. Silwood2]CAF4259032.1 unnamed protein product [Rotaria sp. Silwood2]CAF4555905.1 unnamed protein product [Rotaria sp. Silwood2]